MLFDFSVKVCVGAIYLSPYVSPILVANEIYQNACSTFFFGIQNFWLVFTRLVFFQTLDTCDAALKALISGNDVCLPPMPWPWTCESCATESSSD
jgi:hypothetical protein